MYRMKSGHDATPKLWINLPKNYGLGQAGRFGP
jgi:hypothetical protein